MGWKKKDTKWVIIIGITRIFYEGVDHKRSGAYSVKYSNESLEDKNNLNEIILIGFFFLFLTFKRGVVHT